MSSYGRHRTTGKPKVRVFDSGPDGPFDRYTVMIGDDLYTMSENATSPQGVNQYAGYYEGISERDRRNEVEIPLDKAPEQVRRAIKERQKRE